MSIIDDKKSIFGGIAALRTVNGGLPNLTNGSSFSSVNNDGDTLNFTTDLLKSLVGYERLKNILVDILVYSLDDILSSTNNNIKNELKSLISCSINPSIPSNFLNSGSGINIQVKSIDFGDVLKTNPVSNEGSIVYSDIQNGLNSSDFNTFLFNTLQNPNTQQTWGNQTTQNPIMNVQFNPSSTPSNTLNLKASSFYSNQSNNKSLVDLNNNLIGSIGSTSAKKILGSLFNNSLGVLDANRSLESIENELKLDSLIEKVLNSDGDDVFDDSYFTFSKEETFNIERLAKNRKKGVIEMVTCTNIELETSLETISSNLSVVDNSSNKVELKTNINNTIDNTSDELNVDVNDVDSESTKLNFIDSLLKNLIKSIVKNIFSPGLMSVFLLNHIITNPTTPTFNSPLDFIRQNKLLGRNIITSVRDAIVRVLLREVLKELTTLVAQNATQRAIEKGKNYSNQTLSLLGVPPQITSLINNL